MESEVPFAVGLIDLDGAPLRLFGRIEGRPWNELRIGQAVRRRRPTWGTDRSYRFRVRGPAPEGRRRVPRCRRRFKRAAYLYTPQVSRPHGSRRARATMQLSSDWWRRNGWTVAILLSAFGIAFAIRTLWTYPIIQQWGALYTYAGGSDSYYHSRVMTYIIQNHTNLIKDPLLRFPFGEVNPREPLFDWMNAVLGIVFAPLFGGNAVNAAGWFLDFQGPFWAALSVFPGLPDREGGQLAPDGPHRGHDLSHDPGRHSIRRSSGMRTTSPFTRSSSSSWSTRGSGRSRRSAPVVTWFVTATRSRSSPESGPSGSTTGRG